MDEGRVIGYENSIPWKVPGEQKRFAQLTTGHTVLMGRKTYESLPDRYRPLPNRKNVVATRNPEGLDLPEEVEICGDPKEYIQMVQAGQCEIPTDLLWVIGGAGIYEATVDLWDEVNLTVVDGKHEGDTWFPEFEKDLSLVETEEGDGCSFLLYKREC